MAEEKQLPDLVITDDMAPVIYVPGGLDQFLNQIREAVNEVPDLSTKKGRDRVATLAAQVSRSKTAVEKPGRAYLKRLKEAVKPAEEALRHFVDDCDTLRDEVRRPLTEYEDAEKARVAELNERLDALRSTGTVLDDFGKLLPTEAITCRLTFAKETVIDDSWQELTAEAGVAKDAVIVKLEAALVEAKKRDAEAAELERLRKEQIRRDVEASAKRQAEAEAQARIDEANRNAKEEVERQRIAHECALSEISGIQQQVIIAQSGRLGVRKGGTIECLRETLAETEAWPIDERFGVLISSAEKAKQQAIEQIRQLLISAETADAQRNQQEEADRIRREEEQLKATQRAEDKARAANVERQRSVNRQVMSDLMEHAHLTEEQAKAVLTAIVRGKVAPDNLSLRY